MRAWFRRSDFTSVMISSSSFLYLRSCASLLSRSAMSWSCSRRRRLYALIFARDRVEGLEHLGLELGLDRGERELALHVVLVEIRLRRALGLVLAIIGAGARLHLEGSRGSRRGRGRRHLRRLAVRARGH